MLTIARKPELKRNEVSGFTLVEMMVAVALVLLMMTMFAEIFSVATGTMSKQKGIAELDQRQRMASTLLRQDLLNRSFRNVFAFRAGDDPLNPITFTSNVSFGNRLGYFYISENDTDNDSDDVLQFTVTNPSTMPPFYGRTRQLQTTAGGASVNPNQPENDDGSFYGEGLGVGTSDSAEVSYFLRNGILYRRVLLVRQKPNTDYTDEPTVNAGTTGMASLVQPGIYPQGAASGEIYVVNATLANRFLQDFDYVAINDLGTTPQMTILAKESGLSNTPTNTTSLGLPSHRFGFQRARTAGQIGYPKEYLDAATASGFIGRFTHEETSHVNFGWPGNPGYGTDGVIGNSDDTNPYTKTGLTLIPNGAVTDYAGGNRQGEDILLTNVQGFDVKVWDPGAGPGPDGAYGIAGIDDDGMNGIDDAGELGSVGSDDGAFVDIGYGPTTAPGSYVAGKGYYFAQFNNQNTLFGPRQTTTNRTFDTWNVNAAGAGLGAAPFQPWRVGPDGVPGTPGDDDGMNGPDDIGELGWPNSDDVPVPVSAIQIKVRFLDIASGLVREVTIVQSLTP